MKCVKCGSESSPNAKFCPKCGAPIPETSVPTPPVSPAPNNTAVQPTPVKGGHRKMVVGVVIAAVVLLCALILIYLLSPPHPGGSYRSQQMQESQKVLQSNETIPATPPSATLASKNNIEQKSEQQEFQKREHVATINRDCKIAYTASMAYDADHPNASNITLAQIRDIGYNQSTGVTTILNNVSANSGTITCSGPYEWGVSDAVVNIAGDGTMKLTISKIK